MGTRTIDEHRRAVAALLAPLGAARATETLTVSASRITAAPDIYRGRVLAQDLLCPADLPPFDNSQMDGYAVRAGDLQDATPDAPTRLSLAGQINAGEPGDALEAGQAAAIMTGAPLPQGADAVVPIERADPPRFQTTASGGAAAGVSQNVAFDAPVSPGSFVRRRGSDVRAGEVLLPEGVRLGPAQLGVIAGAGLTRMTVLRRIRVLVVATGNELREPGTPLEPGMIHDSNSTMLTQALVGAGCTVVAWPCRSDDSAELMRILDRAAGTADLVITVGGVSQGAREVVREALGPLGVEFMSVAMQPGGPQGLGIVTLDGQDAPTPVISFPGNPVSALVSFEVFLRPLLRRLAGCAAGDRPQEWAPLAEPADSPPAKHQLRRGRLDADGRVHLVGGPSSHLLHSYAASNLLVHLPVGLAHANIGHTVEIWRIDD